VTAVTLPPPAPVVAVGGVAVVGDALLLVRRRHPPEAGRWSLPGGRVEPGESVAEAVERELWEETSLRVRCGAFLGWVERRGPDFHFVILDFTVSSVGPRAVTAGGDAKAAAWVPLGEVPSLDLVSGMAEFLKDHGVLDGSRHRA
jgi:acetyl-CoA carboxylase carboxyl transferase subunit beta